MAAADLSMALVGASSLPGCEIKERLADGPLASARIRLLETGAQEATITDFGDEAAIALQIEPNSLEAEDIVILACSAIDGERILGYPRKPGATVVDLSGAKTSESAPLVIMPSGLGALPAGGGVVRAPRSIPLFLSKVLSAAIAKVPLAEVDVLVFEPASGVSREALDELYQQAVHLLNFSDLPREVYGRQMAFNLVPLTLAGNLGGAEREASLARETADALGWEPGRCGLKILVAPVFHTHSAQIRVVPGPESGGGSAEGLREAFSGAGFSLEPARSVRGGTGEDAGRSTPAEWAGEERIRIGEVVPDGRGAFRIWALCDDLKDGAARNVVDLCEALAGVGVP